MLDTDFRLLVSADTPRESAVRAAEAVPSGGIFYYALGGGMGHLMRAHAMARSLARIDTRPFVTLTNARFAQPEVPIRLQLEGRPQPGELGGLIQALLTALRPSVFVIDAFPAGILRELEPSLRELSCPKLAILRRLLPEWIERWELPRVLSSMYDAVALIEPGARFQDYPEGTRTLETAPILARGAAEVLSRKVAREILGHEGDSPLVLSTITGDTAGDYGILRAAETHLRQVCGNRAELRLAAPLPPIGHEARTIFHVPLMELLMGVDLVIGPCGYNLAHETAALMTPAIFLPQRRTYDDQRGRAHGRLIARSGDELESLLRVILSGEFQRTAPQFENGAEEVAALIAGFT